MANESFNVRKFEEKKQLQSQKKKGNEALKNIKTFYQKNSKVCQRAYDYYSDFQNNISQYLLEPEWKSPEDFVALLPQKTALVLTVTTIEKGVFLHWLYEKNGQPLTSYIVNDTVLTVYSLNKDAMIIHTSPLHTGEEETRVTLNQVRKIFTPEYLFMLGICYGLNLKKYTIGSVFISNSVSTFRLNFRDEEKSDETLFEAEDEYNRSPNDQMIRSIEQFFSCIKIKSVVSEEQNPTTAIFGFGKLLSSNSLISSHRVKQAVLSQYSNKKPNPLGGEMEAAGILKSNYVEEDDFSNWVIIKSICDWGEKKNQLSSNEIINDKVKDSIQAFAMTNTCGAFIKAMKALFGEI